MPRPHELQEFRRHAEWAIVVAHAFDLGLMQAIGEARLSAEQIASELGLSARGTRTLLGALEEVGLVGRSGDAYVLDREGRDLFLDRDSGRYQGDALRLWLDNVRQWANQLPAAVRSGEPQRGAERPDPDRDPEALRRFMAAMDNKPAEQVERVVEASLRRVPHARSMLDLGGGPGTFARAFAARGLQATLFDRPEVVEHVRTAFQLDRHAGLSVQPGDFLTTLPDQRFDLILLANITHIYDARTNAELIRRVASHLEPDGVVAILDFLRGHGEFASLFAVTMLLNTESGGTYGAPEYRDWLEDAGCREVEVTAIDPDRSLVTALR
jgi:SAM-dependent methyltransferase